MLPGGRVDEKGRPPQEDAEREGRSGGRHGGGSAPLRAWLVRQFTATIARSCWNLSKPDRKLQRLTAALCFAVELK